MNDTYTIKVLKTMTRLLKNGVERAVSKGRPDHAAHILAWCDESGIKVANDPRFAAYRGTYRLVDGQVVKTI